MRVKLLFAILVVAAMVATPLFAGFDTSPPASTVLSMENAYFTSNVNVGVPVAISAPATIVDTSPAYHNGADFVSTTMYAIDQRARSGTMLMIQEAPLWAPRVSTSSARLLLASRGNYHAMRVIRT